MVGFLHDQKDHVGHYQINWSTPVQLKVEPKHVWTDQGHTSNGVAGYGFFLGLFGLYVAWKQRRAQGKTPSKSLLALLVLQFLAVLFTLSAVIFVFLVTYQTKGQTILESVARAAAGTGYPENKWTPETWFKAVLDLPLANQHQHDNIKSKVTNMVVWKWMLIPIFFADMAAFSFTAIEYLQQRKCASKVEYMVVKSNLESDVRQ
ncbi:hypothetical protein K504DRAFT_366523 [Pleomassaria siparia CBS 279.74]|uniref:Uncharacterized protein n=1 Tax=Pleomassaria siparia CBS 279.74 TaxID=1314801 RepID=A0A6G1KT27_9PLEO|nr:hypothetical protein K504DRAFT_366523 [Pleomassaria siparia CBS 279.74]